MRKTKNLYKIGIMIINIIGLLMIILQGCGPRGATGPQGPAGPQASAQSGPTVVALDSTICYTAADAFFITMTSPVSLIQSSFCNPIHYLFWQCYADQTTCLSRTSEVCDAFTGGLQGDAVGIGNNTAWLSPNVIIGCHTQDISYCGLGCD